MGEKLGNSNNVIGETSSGTHFCLFYTMKDNLYDLIVPYFKAGLENNEFCVWVLPEHIDTEKAKQVLGQTLPDLQTYIEKNQIEILPFTAPKKENFNQEGPLDFWVEKLNKAFKSGFSGLRLI